MKDGGTGGASRWVTWWPIRSSNAAMRSVWSQTSGADLRLTDVMHTATRRRARPGRVTSPIGASLPPCQTLSASR